MSTVVLTREEIESAENGFIEVLDPDGNPVGLLPAKLWPYEFKDSIERVGGYLKDPQSMPEKHPAGDLLEKTIERINAEEGKTPS